MFFFFLQMAHYYKVFDDSGCPHTLEQSVGFIILSPRFLPFPVWYSWVRKSFLTRVSWISSPIEDFQMEQMLGRTQITLHTPCRPPESKDFSSCSLYMLIISYIQQSHTLGAYILFLHFALSHWPIFKLVLWRRSVILTISTVHAWHSMNYAGSPHWSQRAGFWRRLQWDAGEGKYIRRSYGSSVRWLRLENKNRKELDLFSDISTGCKDYSTLLVVVIEVKRADWWMLCAF